jgi:hypothetical protein
MGPRGPLFALALALLACGGPHIFHGLRAGTVLPPGRVVVIGSVRFDPPLGRVGRPVASDPRRFFSSAHVGLTEAHTPLGRSRGQVSGLDGRASTFDEDGYFAFDAPAHPFYIRSVSHYMGEMLGDQRMMVVRELWYLHCEAAFRVTPVPEDTRIYVGELVCHHNDMLPLDLTVEDRFDPARVPDAAAMGPTAIVRRLAVLEPE